MKHLVTIILSLLTVLIFVTAPSCNKSADSTASADSLRKADSLAKVRADSLARVMHERRIDSINRTFTSPDLEFFSAHGTIDTINYISACEWIGTPRADVMTFDSLGNLAGSAAVRHNGHIVRYESHSYAWSGNRIVFVGTAEFGADESEYNQLNRSYLKHRYDDAGNLVESEVRNNLDEMRIVYTYAVTDTDRFGNWLSRTVTRRELETGSGRELRSEDIPEQRTITYRLH